MAKDIFDINNSDTIINGNATIYCLQTGRLDTIDLGSTTYSITTLGNKYQDRWDDIGYYTGSDSVDGGFYTGDEINGGEA